MSVNHVSPAAIAMIDGWPINLANQGEAVWKIIETASTGETFAVFTLNLDHLVKLRRSAAFRRAYASARYVTADGSPVVRLAARNGVLVERTTGADLIVPLAKAAARAKLPIYLFGTTPEVLASVSRDLRRRTDFALEVAGTESPPPGFDPEGSEADAALDRIAASGARLCFVALGAPKQELLAARAVERDINVGFICIGAGLDFLTGAQVRAPGFMQRSGLEWLWRLATNPRRMTARYAQCALVLAQIALLAPLKQRLARMRA